MTALQTMELDIVSAEAAIFRGNVQMLSVTGKMGELGIHPGHTALLTELKPGQVHAILENGSEEIFYISGGMLEVQPTMVTILANMAVRAEDLDEMAAKAASERASNLLSQNKAGIEYSKALAELAQAMAQLHAIDMIRKRKK